MIKTEIVRKPTISLNAIRTSTRTFMATFVVSVLDVKGMYQRSRQTFGMSVAFHTTP